MATKLTVNGEERSIDADQNMPLLWALRDELKLTGNKFGCGIAQCGSCTVHVNGESVRSCQAFLGDLDGADVITIEAVEGPEADALRQAWTELDIPQCGYCQSGQIMAAVAMLKNKPNPNERVIDSTMSGNVCRCVTYHRIRAGIHRAAEILKG